MDRTPNTTDPRGRAGQVSSITVIMFGWGLIGLDCEPRVYGGVLVLFTQSKVVFDHRVVQFVVTVPLQFLFRRRFPAERELIQLIGFLLVLTL
jgi:hypothetical protein